MHVNNLFLFYNQNDSNKLFDIAICKCKNIRACSCSENHKLTPEQYFFLFDQRGNRQKYLNIQTTSNQILSTSNQTQSSSNQIGSAHTKSTKKQAEHNLIQKIPSLLDENSNVVQNDSPRVVLRSRIVDYTTEKANSKIYNTHKYPQVAVVADRLKLSNRQTAQMVNATLGDAGLLSSANKSQAVGAKKIRMARKRERERRMEEISCEGIEAIFFDGRKDETFEIINGARKSVQREHISFVQEPGSFYVGHKTLPSGHSCEILKAINEIITEKSININDIKALGCDGTNANTGHVGGLIRLFEVYHNKAVQWIVCMLHGIELQVRALIENLDGPFKSKENLSGPIGQMLNDCASLKVVKFEPIDFPCDVLDADVVLSTDHKYLYEMCTAISKGSVHPSLASRTCGPVNKARWATTACRFLRVYVGTEKPSANFRIIVQFIMRVYAPSMFKMKYQSSVVFAALHLAEIIKSSRFLPPRARSLVDASISRNAYSAHAESVTLAMLNDDREEIRRQGWLNILNARKANVSNGVREFRVPTVNFKCDSYLTLNDFDRADPPLLRDISVSLENMDMLASKNILAHDFGAHLRNIPLHTQAVERAVKETTSAAKHLNSETNRDGFVFNTLASRSVVPTFHSKQDFCEVQPLKQFKI